jgi:hypothetical protein
MATGLDSFSLLAIPFFILAGNIMNSGGIAMRLINLARVLVGKWPAGLAFVNVFANMLFGAISGSAAASASAIGAIMGPEMKKEGYDDNFSAAVNISSATTGLAIPPKQYPHRLLACQWWRIYYRIVPCRLYTRNFNRRGYHAYGHEHGNLQRKGNWFYLE